MNRREFAKVGAAGVLAACAMGLSGTRKARGKSFTLAPGEQLEGKEIHGSVYMGTGCRMVDCRIVTHNTENAVSVTGDNGYIAHCSFTCSDSGFSF